MIRRPPRSTQSRSSAASDVYKRQDSTNPTWYNSWIFMQRLKIMIEEGLKMNKSLFFSSNTQKTIDDYINNLFARISWIPYMQYMRNYWISNLVSNYDWETFINGESIYSVWMKNFIYDHIKDVEFHPRQCNALLRMLKFFSHINWMHWRLTCFPQLFLWYFVIPIHVFLKYLIYLNIRVPYSKINVRLW